MRHCHLPLNVAVGPATRALARFYAGLVLIVSVASRPATSDSLHPAKRIDYAITYAPFLHSVVMHGGWAPPDWKPSNEMWRWDQRGWSQMTETGSPAFAHHTMAVDLSRNLLVICGRPSQQQNKYETWEFDGRRWSQDADIPVDSQAQGDPKLTYDVGRKRLVLYVARQGGKAEVWEFDGKSWRLIRSKHQPSRCDENGCLFQYDEDLRVSVLVGEERTSRDPLAWGGHEWGMAGGMGTETWLWNGLDLVQIRGEQPPRAVWGGLTFDEMRRGLILITTRMETWTLRSNGWKKLHLTAAPSPAPNGFFSMAYDRGRHISLFFGGESRPTEREDGWAYPETTWVFDGVTWTSH